MLKNTSTEFRWEVRKVTKGSHRWLSVGAYKTRSEARDAMRACSSDAVKSWIVDTWEDHYGNIIRPKPWLFVCAFETKQEAKSRMRDLFGGKNGVILDSRENPGKMVLQAAL